MKKLVSILLVALLVCSFSVCAFAGSQNQADIPEVGTPAAKEEQAEIVTDLDTLTDEQKADVEKAQETMDAISEDPKSNEEVAAAAGEEEVVLSGWYYVAAPGVKTFSEEDAANMIGVLFIPSGDTLAGLLSLDGTKVTFPSTGMACDVFRAVAESPAA